MIELIGTESLTRLQALALLKAACAAMRHDGKEGDALTAKERVRLNEAIEKLAFALGLRELPGG
jgi:hypothetical protein